MNFLSAYTNLEFCCDYTGQSLFRFFTGKHMDAFGLINMNRTVGELMERSGITFGRVYDPAVALFLSPDPVLQDPANALNYNRYSYVLNNPLKYTDPGGYHAATFYTIAVLAMGFILILEAITVGVVKSDFPG